MIYKNGDQPVSLGDKDSYWGYYEIKNKCRMDNR